MARHNIKVLGKGCGSCLWTERLLRESVAQLGVDADVEKVTRTADMVPYGVLSTPAVVIDEKVVHAGGIPTKADVEGWLRALTQARHPMG